MEPCSSPPPFDGNDSEVSEIDTDSESESDEGDLDYVPTCESSCESDEPLSSYQRRRQDNATGTEGFVWRKKENVPRRHGFRAAPGVKEAHLCKESTPLDIFSCFLTDELLATIVEETNR